MSNVALVDAELLATCDWFDDPWRSVCLRNEFELLQLQSAIDVDYYITNHMLHREYKQDQVDFKQPYETKKKLTCVCKLLNETKWY